MQNLYGCCLLEVSAEEYKRRRFSLALGCVVDAAAVSLLLVAGVLFPYRVAEERAAKAHEYLMITLPPPPVEPKPLFKALPLPRVVARKNEPPKLPLPEIKPAPRVEPPKIERPPIQARIPVPTVTQQPRPVEAFAARSQSRPAPLRPAAPIHTGLFTQVATHAGGDHTPLNRVQTGGFGSPQGLPGRALGGNPGNVPKLGAFDLPAGPGQGNGTGGAQGSARTVAVETGGFGDGGVVDSGTGRGPGGGATGGVKTGAFGAPLQSASAPEKPTSPQPPPPATQPVQILSKPSPQYTEEARRLRVQGEVVLSVVFQANGALKVVGVVKSLGHGLDQMAEQAAAQIRFKPAEQDGKPVNFPATLRIEFRLA